MMIFFYIILTMLAKTVVKLGEYTIEKLALKLQIYNSKIFNMKKKIFTITFLSLSLLIFNLAMSLDNELSFVFLIISFPLFMILAFSFATLRNLGRQKTELKEQCQ